MDTHKLVAKLESAAEIVGSALDQAASAVEAFLNSASPVGSAQNERAHTGHDGHVCKRNCGGECGGGGGCCGEKIAESIIPPTNNKAFMRADDINASIVRAHAVLVNAESLRVRAILTAPANIKLTTSAAVQAVAANCMVLISSGKEMFAALRVTDGSVVIVSIQPTLNGRLKDAVVEASVRILGRFIDGRIHSFDAASESVDGVDAILLPAIKRNMKAFISVSRLLSGQATLEDRRDCSRIPVVRLHDVDLPADHTDTNKDERSAKTDLTSAGRSTADRVLRQEYTPHRPARGQLLDDTPAPLQDSHRDSAPKLVKDEMPMSLGFPLSDLPDYEVKGLLEEVADTLVQTPDKKAVGVASGLTADAFVEMMSDKDNADDFDAVSLIVALSLGETGMVCSLVVCAFVEAAVASGKGGMLLAELLNGALGRLVYEDFCRLLFTQKSRTTAIDDPLPLDAAALILNNDGLHRLLGMSGEKLIEKALNEAPALLEKWEASVRGNGVLSHSSEDIPL